jgi:hypothetical protein
MILKPEQIEEFKAVCGPLVHWLRENCHPHAYVIIDDNNAELLEGTQVVHYQERSRVAVPTAYHNLNKPQEKKEG